MTAGVKIRRKVLGDLLEAHLTAGLVAGPGVPLVSVYRGEVPKGQPPEMPDAPGRIAPYVVLFDGVGLPDIEPDLGGQNVDLRWSAQMIVGAGFLPDCAATVDRICDLVYRWTPALGNGLAAGRMEPPPGYDPGPLRRNDSVSPPRWWTPLQWRIDVTT